MPFPAFNTRIFEANAWEILRALQTATRACLAENAALVVGGRIFSGKEAHDRERQLVYKYTFCFWFKAIAIHAATPVIHRGIFEGQSCFLLAEVFGGRPNSEQAKGLYFEFAQKRTAKPGDESCGEISCCGVHTAPSCYGVHNTPDCCPVWYWWYELRPY